MNKFNPKILTRIQQTSIMPIIRIYHYDVNYNINEDLTNYIMDFRIDKTDNITIDNIDFNLLKKEVINNKLIGIILYGSEIDDKIISIYKQQEVTTNIKDICISLLSNYFKDNKEIEKYCKKVPNYNIYVDIIP